jgi:Domain of unknown function (DUF5666)
MSSRNLLAVSLMLILAGTAARAMAQDASPQSQQQAPGGSGQRGPRSGRNDGPAPLIGKITVLKGSSLELTRPDGTTVTVALTEKTEFRKDRQPAKAADFKVGDMVFVRGEPNADKTVTAAVVAARSGSFPDGGEGGRGFGGGGGPALLGELGKDYVAGEIKSVDTPKLTVLRPDNVTQTIELTEDSSLRKGRESITMADIQPGDHVIARGTMQNNVFVPKNVMILSAEQWQRMQEMGARRRSGEGTPADARPNSPTPQPPTMNQPQ